MNFIRIETAQINLLFDATIIKRKIIHIFYIILSCQFMIFTRSIIIALNSSARYRWVCDSNHSGISVSRTLRPGLYDQEICCKALLKVLGSS